MGDTPKDAPKTPEEIMDDTSRVIHWSNQLETLIAREAEKCRGLAWIHQRAELQQTYRNNMVQIPVIILSTLAGTASVGSTALFPDNAQVASIIIGGISIAVGVMNTLANYYSFAKRSEAHRIAYIQYSKLFSQISIELSLPRNERADPPILLKLIRDTMERLSETTPSPPVSIINAFNKTFKDVEGIAVPAETNGLEKVIVFRDETRPTRLKEILSKKINIDKIKTMVKDAPTS
jgi:hypothetical protein